MTKDATSDVDPDRGLVLACQEALRAGHTAPFDELYALYRARVYRQCLRFLRNDFDANDACQDAFQRVMRHIATFDHDGPFARWLGNVTRNCCRDLLRRSRRAQRNGWTPASAGLAAVEETGVAVMDSPAAALSRHELRRRLEQSIDRLTPPLRAVVVMRYFAQCSYGEIARRLGLSMGTVKSRLSRAHATLADDLARRLDPEELRGVA
jgi:RNA polymerase sigma-70 factor (ECF subfamily)